MVIFGMDGEKLISQLVRMVLLLISSKKAWMRCKLKDVVIAVQSFLLLGRLLGEVNATILSLILKCPNPSKMGDF